MRWFKVAVARLKGFARGDKIDSEIDEELRCHIEMVTEANVRSGMSLDEARRAAVRSFGNLARVKDRARDIRGGGMLDILWQDLRFGLRMLAKRPGFTLVAVTALALGIGANTAIFSVVNTVLLRPLPFEDPERIVSLSTFNIQTPDARGPFSYPNFADVKARSQTIEDMAVCLGAGAVLSGTDGPEVVFGADVSAELFPILGVQPALGRVFTAEEDKEGAPPVVVLSHDLWQTRFGGDPSIIGQTIKLSGSRTVIGVMPAGFKFPIEFEKPAQFWGPFLPDMDPKYKTGRSLIFLPVVAKLKPGVTIEQANAELNSIAASLEAEYPDVNTGRRIGIV
ncbi:MAG TPA: ABC transporter permease, partial [Blastocatellia bacterium]|nr:ABC transporter permease [Blastocatellia bacterium]